MYRFLLRARFSGIRLKILVLLGLMLLSSGGSNAALREDEQKLLSAISVTRMMSDIERLCSDEFRGRRAGSPEHYAVADYLASKFGECGLSPLEGPGLEGYKQPLTMRYSLVRSKDEIRARLTYRINGRHGPINRTRSFSYRGYNGRGGLDLESEVVFVGYGTDSDYAGLDVAGKIVLWLSGRPKDAKPITGMHKMTTAYQHGAAACLMYKPAGVRDEWGTNIGLSGSIADFPYIAVDETIVSEILPLPAGLPAKGTRKPQAGARGLKVRLQITPVCDPDRRTYNVIGMLPGADPQVSQEIVLVGAHYDHLGDDGQGRIFRGADDNASGAAVVLEIARVIADSGLKPRRTIVLAAWTGEEAGLVGSNYFAANPPFPLENIVSSIQLDMVGAGTPGMFVTAGTAYPDRYRYLAESAADLRLSLRPDTVGASDHLAFARRKVPSFLLHSAGEHPNVHTVRDRPTAINRKTLESAARLAALAVWRAANG